MRRRLASLAIIASTFGLTGWTFGADDPKPTPTKPAAGDKPAAGAQGGGQRGGPGGGQNGGGPGGGGGQRGGGRGFGGFGGPGGGMNFMPDPVDELVRTLSDLNMNVGFTLSDEQKAKIKKIREEARSQNDQWRTDHEADFKKIQDQFTALRTGGGGDGDREKFQAIEQSRQELMADAPKGDDAIADLKGLLTNDQLKALDARLAERKAPGDRRGGPGGNPGGNPGGGGNGRGAAPAGEKPAPKAPAGGI